MCDVRWQQRTDILAILKFYSYITEHCIIGFQQLQFDSVVFQDHKVFINEMLGKGAENVKQSQVVKDLEKSFVRKPK